jgi:hypothetical protein
MHTDDIVLVCVGPEVKVDTVIIARHPDDGYVCKRVTKVRRHGIELASLELGRPADHHSARPGTRRVAEVSSVGSVRCTQPLGNVLDRRGATVQHGQFLGVQLLEFTSQRANTPRPPLRE